MAAEVNKVDMIFRAPVHLGNLDNAGFVQSEVFNCSVSGFHYLSRSSKNPKMMKQTDYRPCVLVDESDQREWVGFWILLCMYASTFI